MMKGLRRYEVALLAVLFVSIVLNLLLSHEVVSLRETLAVLKSEGQLSVGDPLPPFQAFDLTGKAVSVSYLDGTQPTLLYVFSPSCGWCTRNLPNIRQLTLALRNEYRILGISLSSQELESYIQEKGLEFPVLTQASPASIEAYKLGGTPQTLVISPQGILLKNWLGAYVDQVNEDIQHYFNTQLPGIEELKNKAAGGM